MNFKSAQSHYVTPRSAQSCQLLLLQHFTAMIRQIQNPELNHFNCRHLKMTLTLDIFFPTQEQILQLVSNFRPKRLLSPPTTASEDGACDRLLNNTAEHLWSLAVKVSQHRRMGRGLQCCNQELSHWTTAPKPTATPLLSGELHR